MPLLLGLLGIGSTIRRRLGNAAALGVSRCLCLPKCSPSCFFFGCFVLFFLILAFSFLKYPWHHLATSGIGRFLFCFHHFPLFSPRFCPGAAFGLCQVPAWSSARCCRAPALGLAFAAFNENSAEAIYIFLNR